MSGHVSLLTYLQVDKPATFTVSFNGASGELHSYMRSPSGGHDDCFTQEMDTGLYAIRSVTLHTYHHNQNDITKHVTLS